MTRYDPSLFVERMLILLGDHFVYDQAFHRGLNVIRGENSSGKSTIVDFLFYSMGGDFTAWKPEAARCETVLVQLEINGAKLTLQRDVDTAPRRPIRVFWGSIDDALRAGPAEWELYPYATTPSKESFSLLLFRAMGIPEVKSELQSRLTMHQLLRLMYVDQATPYSSMFRLERFDDHRIRGAIGAVLCGYHSDRLFDLQLEIRRIEDELRDARTRIKLLDELLSEAEQADSEIALRAQLDSTRTKLHEARAVVDKELASTWTKPQIEKEHKKLLRTARKAVASVSSALRTHKGEHDRLQFEIEDSAIFIESLQTTLKALAEAESVREALGELPLHTCPACHAYLEAPEDEDVCPLCKSPKPASGDRTQVSRMRQELALQLRESIELQNDRDTRLQRLERRIPELESADDSAREHYERLQESVDLVLEVGIGEAYRQVGYLEGVVEDLSRQVRLVESLDELRTARDDMGGKLGTLREALEGEETALAQRRAKADQLIATRAIEILRQDLDREETFQSATRFEFTFDDGHILLDGRANFAASSMVILKNSFHLALLAASTMEKVFRYPRLLLIDNVEDKGMEDTRSHNFQMIMRELSQNLNVDHQIIATTSKIAPELEDSDVTVGDSYTHDHKSLDLP